MSISIDKIADALSEDGYIVIPHALDVDVLNGLQQRVTRLSPEQWLSAGVGRNADYQHNKKVRSDKLCWISRDDPQESIFLESMELLRQGLNQRLYMGLFDFESHFATYPEGAYYQKHVDALRGRSNRVLTVILYLNEGWSADDGGELLVYPEHQECQKKEPIQRVVPELGTMVVFLSEQFPHEVL
ncbi:MAG: 2OG-Fe(II) oxygenase, partial [Pseudomonadales bacterium]|nr:2OG-Fe(II) oxygenase [Pseudomonadales bacterium]